MALNKIANLYASSLVDICLKNNVLSQVKEELKLISDLFCEDADLNHFLTSPSIPTEAKKKFIDDGFSSKITQYTYNLLNILIDNGRQSEIGNLYEALLEEIDRVENKMKVTVVTSIQLEESVKVKIAEILKKKFAKEVSIYEEINEEILGGIVIKIGDLVIDGSLNNDLKKLKERLLYSKFGSDATYED